ncbi:methyltransferase domain-containing protein [Halobacillus salinarum]|uniref:Methyltransferase domain-containing protein n=1 Tax=Halobacillus salinarum TaxID=2932257 RepID=A0ABY4ER12_9BACI|nr:class I SAM-dependent methyltransferase [Halobacillus salinarum]UOQ46094.1 methyltransferase domain-containing protein [Halobacillus salinarum]
MTLLRILEYAHDLLKNTISKGDIVIDGTCGNGHDTAFLAQLVGSEGFVYGFDLQSQAITNTSSRVAQHGMDNRVELFHTSHSNLNKLIAEEHKGKIQGAIYNLGYLPGSDKTVITTPEETVSSLQQLIELLNHGGMAVVVVYHGHPGGEEEKHAVVSFAESLNQTHYEVLKYQFINQQNSPPFILAIEKKPE